MGAAKCSAAQIQAFCGPTTTMDVSGRKAVRPPMETCNYQFPEKIKSKDEVLDQFFGDFSLRVNMWMTEQLLRVLRPCYVATSNLPSTATCAEQLAEVRE